MVYGPVTKQEYESQQRAKQIYARKRAEELRSRFEEAKRRQGGQGTTIVRPQGPPEKPVPSPTVEEQPITFTSPGQMVTVRFETPTGKYVTASFKASEAQNLINRQIEEAGYRVISMTGPSGKTFYKTQTLPEYKQTLQSHYKETGRVPPSYKEQIIVPKEIKSLSPMAEKEYYHASYKTSIGFNQEQVMKDYQRNIDKYITVDWAKQNLRFDDKTFQQLKKTEPALELRKTTGGFETYLDIESWQKRENNLFGSVSSYVFPSWEDQISRIKNQLLGNPSIKSQQEFSINIGKERQYYLTKKWNAGDYGGLALDVVSSPGVSIPLTIYGGKGLGMGFKAFSGTRIGSRVLFNVGTRAITPTTVVGAGMTTAFGASAMFQTKDIVQEGIKSKDYTTTGLRLFTFGALAYSGYRGFKAGMSGVTKSGQRFVQKADVYEVEPGRYEYTLGFKGQKNITARGITQQKLLGNEFVQSINRGYYIRQKGLLFKRNVYQPYRTVSISRGSQLGDTGDMFFSRDVITSQTRMGRWTKNVPDVYKPMNFRTTRYDMSIGILGSKTYEPGESFLEIIDGKHFFATSKTKQGIFSSRYLTSDRNIVQTFGKISYPKPTESMSMGGFTGSKFDTIPLTRTKGLEIVMPGGLGVTMNKPVYPILFTPLREFSTYRTRKNIDMFDTGIVSSSYWDKVKPVMNTGQNMISDVKNSFLQINKNIQKPYIGSRQSIGLLPGSRSLSDIMNISRSDVSQVQSVIPIQRQSSIQLQKQFEKTVTPSLNVFTGSSRIRIPFLFSMDNTGKKTKKKKPSLDILGKGYRTRKWKTPKVDDLFPNKLKKRFKTMF